MKKILDNSANCIYNLYKINNLRIKGGISKRMKFKNLLKSKRFTPASISPLLGLSDKAIYNYIYGRATPGPDTVLKLAKILEVSEREILECFSKEKK